ncbi:MAG TPA: hypothetical protein VFZ42_05475 [Chitinophagaceae bacterium]
MRKNILRIAFVSAAIAGTLLVLGSTKSSTPSKSAPCAAPAQECCKKTDGKSENMMFESLSGQFFTSAVLH